VHMMVVFVDSTTNMNDERVFLVDQSGILYVINVGFFNQYINLKNFF
jgi:hypothetical protein